MTFHELNVFKKDLYVYRIKDKETGEYCKNYNNEPCECGTKAWAEILLASCKTKNPEKKLMLVREKLNV